MKKQLKLKPKLKAKEKPKLKSRLKKKPEVLFKQKKNQPPSLRPRKIKIKIVGLGGGAGSIIEEMSGSLKGANFLLFDTDQRSFKRLPRKISGLQFGDEETRCLRT